MIPAIYSILLPHAIPQPLPPQARQCGKMSVGEKAYTVQEIGYKPTAPRKSVKQDHIYTLTASGSRAAMIDGSVRCNLRAILRKGPSSHEKLVREVKGYNREKAVKALAELVRKGYISVAEPEGLDSEQS